MRTRHVLASLVAFTAALVTLSAPAPGEAATLTRATCGSVITTDAYLDRDLSCSFTGAATTGITIAADVTLDLRGHRLTCAADCPGKGELSDPYPDAVNVLPGHTARVVHGSIDNWGLGIGSQSGPLSPTATITVSDVTFADNTIALGRMANFHVTASRFDGNAFGYFVADAGTATVTIDRSVFVDQTFAGVDANTETMRLTHNLFAANKVGFSSGYLGDPPASGDYTLSQNAFYGNTRDGVFVLEGGGATASLRSNLALDNGRYGFYAPGAVDLGGNRAGGNGSACVGISCIRVTRSVVPMGDRPGGV